MARFDGRITFDHHLSHALRSRSTPEVSEDMSTTSDLGLGIYTYPEAARIVGIDSRTLRRWVSHYYYSSRGRRYHHSPIIRRHQVDEPVLTFRELIELLFVRMFLNEGVSMRTIRRAADRASQVFASEYPFTLKQFVTDGRHIFATLLEEGQPDPRLIEDVSRGQLALTSVINPFLRKLEYGLEAGDLTLWPKGRDGRVVLDPNRSFGQPIDAETGVPTDVLYAAVTGTAAFTPAEAADWYEVPLEAVEAAIAFEEAPSAL